MTLTALLKTKNGIWKLSAISAMALAISAWIYSRVSFINPAILQDEWIYSITSRQYSPWAQDLPFDFGNYLFNFVYSSTVLCGDAFYSCAKVLNVSFLLGFAFVLFLIALRFMPYWAAAGFLAVALLSPTSVYGSMFLPEPMFFFLLSLALYFLVKFADAPTWKSWAIVGGFLGLAALVKPHALIAAMAVGIYLLVSTAASRPYLKTTASFVGGFVGGLLAVRVVVGFLVAGPKSLNVFGAYGASDALGTFVGGVATGGAAASSSSSLVGAGSVAGAIGLFPDQAYIHSLVVAALLGAGVVAIVISAIDTFKKSTEIRTVHKFALIALIWLLVMVISIVLFTGWVTGGGDDHTLRVLLRYYDYLFPVVALAGLAVAFDTRILPSTTAWVRWVVIAPIFLLISIAFAGFFAKLTIQIADAPNLAGLVVDQTTINVTANLMFLTLLVIAFFPKFTVWSMALLLPWTMVGTGWQIQDQYQGFRGEQAASDRAGLFTKEFLQREDLDNLLILAESRFDGRVASFWLEHNTDLEMLGPGTVYPAASIPVDIEWVLAIGQITLEGGEVVSNEDGYQLIKVRD